MQNTPWVVCEKGRMNEIWHFHGIISINFYNMKFNLQLWKTCFFKNKK
jgi:hypothetical protein